MIDLINNQDKNICLEKINFLNWTLLAVNLNKLSIFFSLYTGKTRKNTFYILNCTLNKVIIKLTISESFYPSPFLIICLDNLGIIHN